jgi:hypothetical protein
MSSTKVSKPNHNAVAEYLQSGIPYVTSSHAMDAGTSVQVSFPTVSRWFVVHNNKAAGGGHKISFGFTQNGVDAVETNNSYILHAGEQTSRMEIKSKDIFVKSLENGSSFSIIAGLTGVPSDSFPTLTGSLEENGVKVLPGVG